METKWTKGQWYVKENGGKGKLVGVASKSSDWFIAEEVLPRDAQLIAAAPDLYEALEAMVGLWDRVHPGVRLGKPTVRGARTALSKARGEQ